MRMPDLSDLSVVTVLRRNCQEVCKQVIRDSLFSRAITTAVAADAVDRYFTSGSVRKGWEGQEWGQCLSAAGTRRKARFRIESTQRRGGYSR